MDAQEEDDDKAKEEANERVHDNVHVRIVYE